MLLLPSISRTTSSVLQDKTVKGNAQSSKDGVKEPRDNSKKAINDNLESSNETTKSGSKRSEEAKEGSCDNKSV